MRNKVISLYNLLPGIIFKRFVTLAVIGGIFTIGFLIGWIVNLFVNGFDIILLIPVLIGPCVIVKAFFDASRACHFGYIEIYGHSVSKLPSESPLFFKKRKARKFTLMVEDVTFIKDGIEEEIPEAFEVPQTVSVPITTSLVPAKNDKILLYVALDAFSYKDLNGITKYDRIFGFQYANAPESDTEEETEA